MLLYRLSVKGFLTVVKSTGLHAYASVTRFVRWLFLRPQASKRQLPMLVDAERPREGLDDLLTYATYVVSSAKFPQVLAKVHCLFSLYSGDMFPVVIRAS